MHLEFLAESTNSAKQLVVQLRDFGTNSGKLQGFLEFFVHREVLRLIRLS